jgi:hypothetical protein
MSIQTGYIEPVKKSYGIIIQFLYFLVRTQSLIRQNFRCKKRTLNYAFCAVVSVRLC